MRSSNKASELEKQVSHLRAQHLAYSNRIGARAVTLQNLIEYRAPLRHLVHSANNALLCSLLYTDERFGTQLARVREQLNTLVARNEAAISAPFAGKPAEVAQLGRLRQLTKALPLQAACSDGYTAYLDGTRVVPVYYLKYREIADVGGFTHSDYSLWFKNGREFSTGFVGWPTAFNWIVVPNQRALLDGLHAAIAQDGLI